MFENQLNPFQNHSLGDGYWTGNIHAQRYNTALNQFRANLLQGKFFRLQARVLRRQPFLYDLNAVKPALHLHGSGYSGMKVVRISSIIGSEGRTSDFDMGFHPLSESSRERWVSVAVAYLSRLPMPPVQLIQIGDAYFIRDGHHRVSVSCAFGQASLDAEVVAWRASPPFPWQLEEATTRLLWLQSADLSP